MVDTGGFDPDSIPLPGIDVHRTMVNANPEKRIEQRNLTILRTMQVCEKGDLVKWMIPYAFLRAAASGPALDTSSSQNHYTHAELRHKQRG